VGKLFKISQKTLNLPAGYVPLCPQCINSMMDRLCHCSDGKGKGKEREVNVKIEEESKGLEYTSENEYKTVLFARGSGCKSATHSFLKALSYCRYPSCPSVPLRCGQGH